MHHPGALAAQPAERAGHRFDPFPGEDPGQLPFDPRRIADRSQQVEDGAGGQFHPGAGNVAHGAVVAGRHQETDAGLGDGLLDQVEIRIRIDAEGSQGIRRAGLRRQRPVAVLRDRYAAGGDDQGGARGNVVCPGGVTAGPHHIHGVVRRFHIEAFGPHGPGCAGDFLDRLAPDTKRHQKAADLSGRRITGHDDVERGLGLRLIQRRAARRRGNVVFHFGHVVHAATLSFSIIFKKFPRMECPCSDAMLSG